MKVKLVCQDSLASPREIVIDSFPCDLGRGVDVTVRIDDRWLSRRHCRLELSEGVIVVRDLGSRHGTFVNGQCITESKLLPGDRLSLGLTHLVAEYELSATDSTLAAAAAPSAAVLA
ncbi:MAG: FHA domain-containing protein [Planctomycetaceae bacterium]|nr:FHA domain-containing protein [Planctomycetaceae bacterium]